MTKTQAVELYLSRYGGEYKGLDPSDVDFRIYKGGQIIAYASVIPLSTPVTKSFPVSVTAKEVVKLCEKRLSPIIIWACPDGIIYAEADQVKGTVQWDKGPLGLDELMIKYKRQDYLKYLKG